MIRVPLAPMPAPRLLTRADVAFRLEVSVHAVDKWRKRPRTGFPQPANVYGQTPVWDETEIVAWGRRTGRL